MPQQSGFQFKQFYLDHSQVAMKVGTDGIMLGSWVEPANAKRVLDIGTGSGLLAIMLAQRATMDCQIVGIDIEPNAVRQAQFNGAQSPWAAKLHFEVSSLQDFTASSFDLIISNPPYFPAGQLFESARQHARHDSRLSITDLIQHSVRLLNTDGRLALVLPADVSDKAVQVAEKFGLYLNQRLRVKTTANKAAKRILLLFSATECSIIEQQLVVQHTQGEYSMDYKQLCRAFYVNF